MMMRHIVFFVMVLIFGSANVVFADELFIPSGMLISGDYQGVFIRDDSKLSQLITLASNSDIIGIPDSLFFAPDQNHATFDITLHGLGEGTIIARTDESFYNVTASIYSDQKKDYNIFLLLPEKTSTQDITGMVFLVDDFFNHVYPDDDVFVSFATSNIDVPKQLKISAGNSHAFFSARIMGDSWITAYTDKSTSDTLNIDYSMAEKKVHIGVAPSTTIAPYSFAYLFVWLTENEIPLEPTLPIKSTLHVSDDDILGIDGQSDNSDTIYLRDGFAMKKLTTNNPGESSITVHVPGYGTASTTVIVDNLLDLDDYLSTELLADGCDLSLIGAGYTGCDSDDIHYASRDQYTRLNPVTLGTLNGTTLDGIIITANVFPSITSGNAYLVWSFHNTVNDIKYPAYGDVGTDFFITSQNLMHEEVVSFETDQRRTQSNIIPISGNIIGEHSISISSPTTLGVTTSELEIAPPIQYSMSVVSLPALNIHDKRPLFAVSILDSDGYVVDPHVIFGGLSVTLLSDDVKFPKNILVLDEPVNIISGTSDLLYPSVTILATDHDIMISNSYKPTSHLLVDIQIPKTVHSGEEFPAYIFLTDTNGKPVSDISKYIQSECNDHGELFSCVVDSEFILFENAIGFATKTLSVFNNQFDSDDIAFDLGDNNPIGVGSKFIIHFEIPSDATLDVMTSIPYVIDDNTVTLQPDFPGQYDVYFMISKSGFETYGINASYLVNNNILLTVNTVTQNGASIQSSVSISHAGEIINVKTPGTADIHRGDIHFEFMPSITIDSTGYSFDHVVISDITYDSTIIDVSLLVPTDVSAVYGQVIKIVTSNAQGGGLYDFGESVTLYAPPHDVVGFLIRDVFDYWDYLPTGSDIYSQTVTLTATESFTTNAVYRQDFTGIVLSVVIAAFLLFAFTRRDKLVSIYRTYTNK